ncbi:hypothetical protein EDC94DRAFT_602115 [Helicostylum pulchrum]|nr:hypothetical protein EDC94DRAFT_602115 [Helicostylum pulchrum]
MRHYASIIIISILTCVQVMCAPLIVSQTTSDISFTSIASILRITIETQEKTIEIWWNFVTQEFNSHQDTSLVSRHLIHGGPNIHAIRRTTRESNLIFSPFPPFPTLPHLPPIPTLPPLPPVSFSPVFGTKT